MKKELQLIKKELNVKEIETELLVENYCYYFMLNNKRYYIEHILNIYGVAVDLWETSGEKKFNTLEETLNYIKGL